MLEPDDGKPSSPALRGVGASNGARLLHMWKSVSESRVYQGWRVCGRYLAVEGRFRFEGMDRGLEMHTPNRPHDLFRLQPGRLSHATPFWYWQKH